MTILYCSKPFYIIFAPCMKQHHPIQKQINNTTLLNSKSRGQAKKIALMNSSCKPLGGSLNGRNFLLWSIKFTSLFMNTTEINYNVLLRVMLHRLSFICFSTDGLEIISAWVGLTLDPFTGKYKSCNKDILPNFRPWCPVPNVAEENLDPDNGVICLAFYGNCIGTTANCGSATGAATICQRRSPLSTIREFIRVAQKEIGNIKNDCNSCKRKD